MYCKLTLLKNGRPFSLEHPSGGHKPVVNSVDRFTWMMMLLISALDSALGIAQLQDIVTRFLTKLFAESVNGTEYLQRDIHIHLEGWRSSACVRGMLHKAREVWNSLGCEGKHWPGFIPLSEGQELLQLLL